MCNDECVSTGECTCDEECMENEVRYYLDFVLSAMHPKKLQEVATESYSFGAAPLAEIAPFVPQYIITAIKLPTGAIEIAINDKCIEDKIKYILDAYDEDMKLKTNPAIEMQNIMIV